MGLKQGGKRVNYFTLEVGYGSEGHTNLVSQ